MKICIKDALKADEYKREYILKSTPADLPSGALSCEASAKLTVSASLGRVYCRTEIDADVTAVCSRCAREFSLPFHADVTRRVKSEEDGFEDVIVTDASDCFEAEEEIRAEIYFGFPAKPLCREDCKGLCPVCGCDLNEKSCSCDTRTPDPRLAVLRQLANND